MTAPLPETPAGVRPRASAGSAAPSSAVAPVAAGDGVRPLDITVYGLPAPQGSKRHLGNGVMVESSKRVRPWREAVKHAALGALGEHHQPIAGPVAVDVTFTFSRPKSHWRTGRNAHLLRDNAPGYPATRASGDVEKLVRATYDALTDAGVWVDDALVVDETSRKRYPHTHPDALTVPGARIRIRPLTTEG